MVPVVSVNEGASLPQGHWHYLQLCHSATACPILRSPMSLATCQA
jgi:hypothetical protein